MRIWMGYSGNYMFLLHSARVKGETFRISSWIHTKTQTLTCLTVDMGCQFGGLNSFHIATCVFIYQRWCRIPSTRWLGSKASQRETKTDKKRMCVLMSLASILPYLANFKSSSGFHKLGLTILLRFKGMGNRTHLSKKTNYFIETQWLQICS